MSRNETVKKKKVNKRRRRKKALLCIFLLFVIALLCGLSLTVFFPVEEISVTGSSLYSSAQIVSACGIDAGENLIRVNEKDVLDSLQNELPFVENVKITKKLPGTVKITVYDAEEVYLFKVDEVYYSTDEKRRILKNYNEKPNDFLFIDCQAEIIEDSVRYIGLEDSKVKEIIGFVSNHIESFSLKADYLDLTDLYAIEMSFDSRFTVNFGEFTYFEEKLAHFLKMAEDVSLKDKSGKVNLSEYTPTNPKAFFVENYKE